MIWNEKWRPKLNFYEVKCRTSGAAHGARLKLCPTLLSKVKWPNTQCLCFNSILCTTLLQVTFVVSSVAYSQRNQFSSNSVLFCTARDCPQLLLSCLINLHRLQLRIENISKVCNVKMSKGCTVVTTAKINIAHIRVPRIICLYGSPF